ncbi:MAG: hypothetical protein H7255_11265 [Ramlibacter sp.]|nr:hypothetical protein [Ramlibacter sp.]
MSSSIGVRAFDDDMGKKKNEEISAALFEKFKPLLPVVQPSLMAHKLQHCVRIGWCRCSSRQFGQ